MLGGLDDKNALKRGYSRPLKYFSDLVSELPLTYHGEFIDVGSIFNVGPKSIALNSIKGTKYSINPSITPPPSGGKGSASSTWVTFSNVFTTDYHTH